MALSSGIQTRDSYLHCFHYRDPSIRRQLEENSTSVSEDLCVDVTSTKVRFDFWCVQLCGPTTAMMQLSMMRVRVVVIVGRISIWCWCWCGGLKQTPVLSFTWQSPTVQLLLLPGGGCRQWGEAVGTWLLLSWRFRLRPLFLSHQVCGTNMQSAWGDTVCSVMGTLQQL